MTPYNAIRKRIAAAGYDNIAEHLMLQDTPARARFFAEVCGEDYLVTALRIAYQQGISDAKWACQNAVTMVEKEETG